MTSPNCGFNWLSWADTQDEAIASQRRAADEDAYPEGQGFDAVHDWRKRQIKEITEGFKSLEASEESF